MNRGIGFAVIACAAVAFLATQQMDASVITVPDSALVSSTSLYTSDFGSIVVMTGGGHANGAGDLTGRNDDGFSGPKNLGFTLNFFGNDYTQFWVDNNGNIAFGNGISAFTPAGPQGAAQPIISPFFADVDTTNSASGVVMLNTSIPNEIIVTWPGVGYYSSQADKTDTFQLVLRGPGFNVPAGEGDVGFFYTSMQWEVGGASGGSGGFCPTGTVGTSCFPAAVGFGDGQNNGYILQNSTDNGIASLVNDKHIWFDLSSSGIPTPVTSTPEPSTIGLLLMGGAALCFARRKA